MNLWCALRAARIIQATESKEEMVRRDKGDVREEKDINSLEQITGCG
jgi:hypothetical protein